MIRRPSQDELLCPLDFGFLENQPDTFQLLRMVKQKADRLSSGLSSAPAPCLAELQRTFYGMGFIFRRDLEHPQVGQIEPAPIKRCPAVGNRGNQAFAHNQILSYFFRESDPIQFTPDTRKTFTKGADGGYPQSDLVMDQTGNLYGTTLYGGDTADCLPYGCGTVFKLRPDNTDKVLHKFIEFDGANPWAGVTPTSSSFAYVLGTTSYGGKGDFGVVFELSLSRAGK